LGVALGAQFLRYTIHVNLLHRLAVPRALVALRGFGMPYYTISTSFYQWALAHMSSRNSVIGGTQDFRNSVRISSFCPRSHTRYGCCYAHPLSEHGGNHYAETSQVAPG
jgi:hypothetical protein